MNTRELDFAYKVRHALNESADKLPPSTLEKLASARKVALFRKKKESGLRIFVPSNLLAANAGNFFSQPFFWLARMGLLLPLVILVVGLASIYQFEQQRRIDDTAEMDAAVLADELPLSAYLDHGFHAYLASQDD